MTDPTRQPGPATRVVLIGLDAGDLDFIRSHLAELPNLRGLFEGGVHALSSPAETLTSAVWPSFASGQGPGGHGIYYPMQWDAGRMQMRRVTEDWLYYEPFWYELARQGRRVTVVDAPFTFPSRLDPQRGIEVLNWGSQECLADYHSNSPQLARDLVRRFGKHPMGDDVPVPEPPHRLAKLRDDLVAGARQKGEVSRWLYENTLPELFVTVFAELHRGGHILWPDFGGRPTGVPADALLDVYRAVDEGIGTLLQAVDLERTLVGVFSVHGMGPNQTQEHFVLPVMERIQSAFGGAPVDAHTGAPEGEAAQGSFNPMRFLRQAVPPRLQLAIANALPVGVRDWVVRRSFQGGLDWRTTLGFALVASGEGYLRFNVKNREAAGALGIHDPEFGRFLELLERGFRSLEAGDEPVVRELAEVQSMYPGPRARCLPDRVVLWNHVLPAEALQSEVLGHFQAKHANGRIGEHRAGGFSVWAGATACLEGDAPPSDVTGFTSFVGRRLGVALG